MSRGGMVQMKRIGDDVSRRTAFGKRRAGLLRKARELAALCDADVGLLVSDGAGQPLDYCSPHTSWSELIQRYESITNAQLQETDDDVDDDDQMFMEIAALRRERDRLEASLRRQTGEDLPPRATKKEFDDLDQRLELTLRKVREMKDKLLEQQLDESHRKVHILEDQHSFLRHMVTENGQHRGAVEAAVGMTTPVLPFGGFFPEVEEQLTTSLQLWPQQLPDVQGFGLQPSENLLNQQLAESHHKVHILEDQNSFLCHMVTENEQHRATVEAVEGTPMLLFGGFFPEVEERLTTSLQLWQQQLPDVQGFGLQPTLRLW